MIATSVIPKELSRKDFVYFATLSICGGIKINNDYPRLAQYTHEVALHWLEIEDDILFLNSYKDDLVKTHIANLILDLRKRGAA